MAIKPQACPRCGGSCYDPDHSTYAGPEPCDKCGGGGTMRHVRKHQDYEDDLAFVDFEHRKLKGINYSLDNPEYADKTQNGARTFLTGGRTLEEAYALAKERMTATPDDFAEKVIDQRDRVIEMQSNTFTEFAAAFNGMYATDHMAKALQIPKSMLRIPTPQVDGMVMVGMWVRMFDRMLAQAAYEAFVIQNRTEDAAALQAAFPDSRVEVTDNAFHVTLYNPKAKP